MDINPVFSRKTSSSHEQASGLVSFLKCESEAQVHAGNRQLRLSFHISKHLLNPY
jgi:hypothetical protein